MVATPNSFLQICCFFGSSPYRDFGCDNRNKR